MELEGELGSGCVGASKIKLVISGQTNSRRLYEYTCARRSGTGRFPGCLSQGGGFQKSHIFHFRITDTGVWVHIWRDGQSNITSGCGSALFIDLNKYLIQFLCGSTSLTSKLSKPTAYCYSSSASLPVPPRFHHPRNQPPAPCYFILITWVAGPPQTPLHILLPWLCHNSLVLPLPAPLQSTPR